MQVLTIVLFFLGYLTARGNDPNCSQTSNGANDNRVSITGQGNGVDVLKPGGYDIKDCAGNNPPEGRIGSDFLTPDAQETMIDTPSLVTGRSISGDQIFTLVTGRKFWRICQICKGGPFAKINSVQYLF